MDRVQKIASQLSPKVRAGYWTPFPSRWVHPQTVKIAPARTRGQAPGWGHGSPVKMEVAWCQLPVVWCQLPVVWCQVLSCCQPICQPHGHMIA